MLLFYASLLSPFLHVATLVFYYHEQNNFQLNTVSIVLGKFVYCRHSLSSSAVAKIVFITMRIIASFDFLSAVQCNDSFHLSLYR